MNIKAAEVTADERLQRLAAVIQRKRRLEAKQDFNRQMSYAMTGILVRSQTPDPRKWWNRPEATTAVYDAMLAWAFRRGDALRLMERQA